MAITLTDLNNFDLLAVRGSDAVKFLQGQLTCNVESVTAQHSVLGACCNLNGSIVVDMRIIAMDSTLFLLTTNKMGSVLKRTLDKYIIFSKAEIADESAGFERYGLYSDDAEKCFLALFGEVPVENNGVKQFKGGIAYRVASVTPRFEILVSRNEPQMLDRLHTMAITDDMEEWELADIRQGIVHITPETQDVYTPQLLNFDLNGIVDFKKGCYTGQEIIARMHYRGKAKKRLYRAITKGHVSIHSTVMHDNKIIGELVSVARAPNGDYEMLLVLPCELAESSQDLELYSPASGTDEEQIRKAHLQIFELP